MTEDEKLKRDPATIIRKAMTHLRKRWDGHKGMDGHANMLILRNALADIGEARCVAMVKKLRSSYENSQVSLR